MPPCAYLFADCRIDLSARELCRNDTLQALSPKVFDCIAYLIAHRDRAVGRDELISAVWGRVDVSDTLLGQTVLKARRAVGDAGNSQNAIRTIPRFGYRWIAAVQPIEAGGDEPGAAVNGSGPVEVTVVPATTAVPSQTPRDATTAPDGTTSPRRPPARYWLVALALLAVALGALAVGVLARRQANVASKSLNEAQDATPRPSPNGSGATAVLPVTVHASAEWSWLRLGLMDLVATRLSGAGVAVVPSDNVVALLHGKTAELAPGAAAITTTLGAAALLRATAEKTADGWVVHLALASAEGGERDVEARSADVIEAARRATDRMLAVLGRNPPTGTVADAALAADELLSRSEAALLSDDLDGARRLIDAAPQPLRDSPAIRWRRAQIDYRAGQLDSARQRMNTLLAETSDESNPLLRARVLNGLGAVDVATERMADAERAFSSSITLLENRNEPALLGQAYTGRAVSYAARGEYAEALADFSRARVALELAGDSLALARVDVNEGIVSATRGHYAEAIAAQQSAATRFERFGALNELISTLANLAEAERLMLRPADATATIERGLPPLHRLENKRTREDFDIERANTLIANGRLGEASRELASVLAQVGITHDALAAALSASARARLAFTEGSYANAAELATTALPALGSANYLRERAQTWLLLTRALRAQGKYADAEAQSRSMLEWISQFAGVPPVPTYAALVEAERDSAPSGRTAALAAYADALSLARKDDVPADVAEVAISFATRLITDGEIDRASAIVGQVARWASRDFGCALLQVRYYRAIGAREAWQSALRAAHALAGERAIPNALTRMPAPPLTSGK